MRTSILLQCLSVASLALVAAPALADLELPHPSPSAKVGVTVGLTDITVDYSSPAARGRKIWGGVVPWGQVWRTGANLTTKLTFSKDVVIADHPLPAGSYAIYTIPNQTSWTVIVSRDIDKPGNVYKKEDDLFRFDVKPQTGPAREHMTFLFSEFDDNGATLDLEWDKVRVGFPIKAKTADQIATGIKNVSENGWRPYANAARYLLDSKGDHDTAMKLVDQSIAIKEDWFNDWVKAQLLASKGQYKAAAALGDKAQTLGQQKPDQFFAAPDVKKALAEWKTKS
jgi:hypothetical protein